MLQKENTKPFLQEHQKPHRCFRLTHKEQRLSDMRDDDTWREKVYMVVKREKENNEKSKKH